MSTIQVFARRHRLKVRTDPKDSTPIIVGRFGHLYQVADQLLGVMVMPPKPSARYWNAAQAKLLEARFVILQDGDYEGSASFNPDDPAQARLAIKIAGAKRKRTISAERREQLIALLRSRRGKA